MPRAHLDYPIHKKSLRLREGDFEDLQSRFPAQGATAVIRRLVAKLVDDLRRQDRAVAPAPDVNVKLEDLTSDE